MATKLSRTSSPVEATLSFMSDKWKVLILRDLLTGTKRFGELKKSMAAFPKSAHLKFARHGRRRPAQAMEEFAEVPPRVEYSLTELGESLKPILDAMMDWGMDYKEKRTTE